MRVASSSHVFGCGSSQSIVNPAASPSRYRPPPGPPAVSCFTCVSAWSAPAAPPALDELVTMASRDVELGPAWTGRPTVSLHPAPGEELAALAPVEMIAGYWRQVGATFAGGERVDPS